MATFNCMIESGCHPTHTNTQAQNKMRQSDSQRKLGFNNENDYSKQDVTEEEEEIYAPSCMRRKSVFNRSDMLHNPVSVNATSTTTTATIINTITATTAATIAMEEEIKCNATNSTTLDNNNNTIIYPSMNIEDTIYHGSEIRSMIGYNRTKWSKIWLYLSLGLLWIIGHWSHWLKAKLLFKESPLREANYVLVQVSNIFPFIIIIIIITLVYIL